MRILGRILLGFLVGAYLAIGAAIVVGAMWMGVLAFQAGLAGTATIFFGAAVLALVSTLGLMLTFRRR